MLSFSPAAVSPLSSSSAAAAVVAGAETMDASISGCSVAGVTQCRGRSGSSEIVLPVPHQRRGEERLRVTLAEGRARAGHVPRAVPLHLPALWRHRQPGTYRQVLPGRTCWRVGRHGHQVKVDTRQRRPPCPLACLAVSLGGSLEGKSSGQFLRYKDSCGGHRGVSGRGEHERFLRAKAATAFSAS